VRLDEMRRQFFLRLFSLHVRVFRFGADGVPEVAGEHPVHARERQRDTTGNTKFSPSARVDRRETCSASTNKNASKEKDSRSDRFARPRSALFFTNRPRGGMRKHGRSLMIFCN